MFTLSPLDDSMRTPGPSQVLAAARSSWRQPLCIDLLQLDLKFADDQQTFVPQPLKLGRDNSILWVHSMILALGSVTLVACLLEDQLNLSANVVYFAFACLDGAKCRSTPIGWICRSTSVLTLSSTRNAPNEMH